MSQRYAPKLRFLYALTAAMGCSEQPAGTPGNSIDPNCPSMAACGPVGGAGTTTAPTPMNPISGVAGTEATPPIGAAGSLGFTGTGGSTPAAGSGGSIGTDAGDTPCEVASIVTEHCTSCHAATPRFGAPMPLMSTADFQKPAKAGATMLVHQSALARIRETDPARIMPPVGSSKLSASDLETFGAWLTAAAPPSMTPACSIMAKSRPPEAGTGGTLPPSTRSGGATIEPQEYDDPEMTCHKFLTHARGDLDAPYMQGPGEQYVNFTFKAPWTGTAYLRAVKIAVAEDAPAMHHWLLFKDTRMKTHGQVDEVGLLGVHPDSELLYGWAPGATPLYFDPDVGMELPGNVSYTLEAHLNNAGIRDVPDHNGSRLGRKPEARGLSVTETGDAGRVKRSRYCSKNGPLIRSWLELVALVSRTSPDELTSRRRLNGSERRRSGAFTKPRLPIG